MLESRLASSLVLVNAGGTNDILHRSIDDEVSLTSSKSLLLPNACICKSSFNAETVCAVSQNERWIPFLGWSPHVLLSSDPAAFSSTDRKITLKVSDGFSLEGPRDDLWAPPEGFEWIPGKSWKVQDMTDRSCDSYGCKFQCSKTLVVFMF